MKTVENNIAQWSDKPDQNATHTLIKRNDSTLVLGSINDTIYFNKTLPISTFLVRARYDFQHSSKWTDSAEIKRRQVTIRK